MHSFYADAESHKYYIDGVEVPSVSTVCNLLYDFSAVPEERLQYKSELGQAVHRAIELMHDDNLNMETVDEVIKPYLQAYEQFMLDTKFTVIDFEKYVWSETWRYAGRLDLTGILNGKRAVIDLKTVTTLSPITALQTAAYAQALVESHDKNGVYLRYALQLKPDGTYRLVDYAGIYDLSVFLSALTIHNWRVKNGCA